MGGEEDNTKARDLDIRLTVLSSEHGFPPITPHACDACTACALLRLKPPMCLLENVTGLRKVLPAVLKELRGTADYNIVCVEISPDNYGAPCTRKRLYFVMVLRFHA